MPSTKAIAARKNIERKQKALKVLIKHATWAGSHPCSSDAKRVEIRDAIGVVWREAHGLDPFDVHDGCELYLLNKGL